MKNSISTLAAIVLLVGIITPIHAQEQRPPLRKLDIFTRGAPKAFFFRASEGYAHGRMRGEYKRWERTFSPLNGIMGKVLGEERPDVIDTNPPFFTRFKRDNPRQMVLLHFDPQARYPGYDRDRFFAGHWLYFNGSTLSESIPAEGGTMSLSVERTDLFRIYGKGENRKTDEIGICRMGPDGEPDWTKAEQVKLVAVDHKAGTIKVRRGQFGTEPKAFPEGSYLAAHRVDRWGSHPIQWIYNLSSTCPVDSKGRTCADVLAAEMTEKLGPGGRLENFDGVEFDIMKFNEWDPPDDPEGRRGPDVNADGKPDWGTVDDLDRWGIGSVRFARQLREGLGPEKLILGDGWTADHQRNFGILNGIESEGWPKLWDPDIVKWSAGLNRHNFWLSRGARPRLSYINHKFRQEGHGVDTPPHIDRLVMAAAAMTGSAFTYSQDPEKSTEHPLGIYDELVSGKEDRANWLGQPAGPARHLALRNPDLLNGRGRNWPDKFVKRLKGEDTHIGRSEGDILRVSSPDDDRETRFQLPEMDPEGKDLVVQLRVCGEPLRYYPGDVAKVIGRLVETRWKTDAETGPLTPEKLMTWADEKWFTATFYFRNVGPEPGRLTFRIEGDAPLYVDTLTLHPGPDAMYRRFENGLVLANPSTRAFTFDLAELAPGASYRRIRGRIAPDVNSGKTVGDKVTLNARDALFLAETNQ